MTGIRPLAAALVLLAAVVPPSPAGSGTARPGAAPPVRPGNDPARVVGPERCGECHVAELDVLGRSEHGKRFYDLARSPLAQDISQALGIGRIKREPRCLGCHFTTGLEEDEPKAIAGVSCESCHGAARDWLDAHYDFGGPDAKAETEPPDARRARHERAVAGGMVPPRDTYRLASRCFACHVVLDEELVERTAHHARSDLELVSWTQGEMRHNFWYTPDRTNREASRDHRRLLLVLGRVLDVEWSLRALAASSHDGRYRGQARERLLASIAAVEELQRRLALPELEALLDAAAPVAAANEALPAREAIDAAAARAREAGERLGASRDGSGLAAVDPLLPAPGDYRGTPVGVQAEAR